jgi:hypothetical protein
VHETDDVDFSRFAMRIRDWGLGFSARPRLAVAVHQQRDEGLVGRWWTSPRRTGCRNLDLRGRSTKLRRRETDRRYARGGRGAADLTAISEVLASDSEAAPTADR